MIILQMLHKFQLIAVKTDIFLKNIKNV